MECSLCEFSSQRGELIHLTRGVTPVPLRSSADLSVGGPVASVAAGFAPLFALSVGVGQPRDLGFAFDGGVSFPVARSVGRVPQLLVEGIFLSRSSERSPDAAE